MSGSPMDPRLRGDDGKVVAIVRTVSPTLLNPPDLCLRAAPCVVSGGGAPSWPRHGLVAYSKLFGPPWWACTGQVPTVLGSTT